MINYNSFPNKNGTWPNVTGKDETSPGMFDGTPYNKNFIDDLWGANQALMSRAGMSPSGVSESASASQRMTAMMRVLGHPGEVVMWWGNSDPATVGARILLCEGQFVQSADYPDLVAATWVGAVDNTADQYYWSTGAFMKFSAAIASASYLNVAGAYFKLPDARGKFLRDVSNGSGDNPDSSGKRPGFEQPEKTLYHEHPVRSLSDRGNFQIRSAGTDVATGGSYGWLVASATRTAPTLVGAEPVDSDGNSLGTKFGTVETRPVNVGCRIGIRY